MPILQKSAATSETPSPFNNRKIPIPPIIKCATINKLSPTGNGIRIATPFGRYHSPDKGFAKKG
jgi:hypothetical protein